MAWSFCHLFIGLLAIDERRYNTPIGNTPIRSLGYDQE
jgi:hypothetical protein